MNAATFDAIVIGAGIVGAACAESFAREGLRVAVLEREIVGGGATAAGMGHIVTMDDSEAQFALTRYSQQLWMDLSRELPADVEYQPCGTLWIAADEEEMREVERKLDYYRARAVPAERVDGTTLARLEPNLRPSLAGALLVQRDAVLYPPCAARFLLERAQSRGTRVFCSRAVDRIESGSVLCSNGTRFSAPVIVNATGAWAETLTPGTHIKMRKGHLVITDRYPNFVRHQLVELGYLKSAHSLTRDSVAFNVQPRSTGQLLIGSSRQYGSANSQIDNALLAQMLQRAQLYLPALANVSTLRTWTGLRAATPDKLPLIGPLPSQPGLFLATGHEGLGITTSLATAALLVDHVLQRPSVIAREPYLPDRIFESAHA